MDGAGRFQIFFAIMFPLVQTGVIVASIFAFQWSWSEFLMPVLFFSDEKSTLAVKIALGYSDVKETVLYNIGMAGILYYTLPLVILFFALRSWNFERIGIETVTRLTLFVATLSTIGLVVLGATSLDAAIRRMGVTRLSLGVENFDDHILEINGRAHHSKEIARAYADARAAGFTNLSFDLMLWLPGQSFASWLRTIDDAVALGIFGALGGEGFRAAGLEAIGADFSSDVAAEKRFRGRRHRRSSHRCRLS